MYLAGPSPLKQTVSKTTKPAVSVQPAVLPVLKVAPKPKPAPKPVPVPKPVAKAGATHTGSAAAPAVEVGERVSGGVAGLLGRVPPLVWAAAAVAVVLWKRR